MFDAKRARSRSPSFGRAAVGRLTAELVAALVIVALAAASFGWFFYGRGLDVPDEGLLLHVGERLAAGEVPYRDVYFIYTPGLQYVLALLFRLLGPSSPSSTRSRLVLHLAVVGIVYALALRLTRWTPLAAADRACHDRHGSDLLSVLSRPRRRVADHPLRESPADAAGCSRADWPLG